MLDDDNQQETTTDQAAATPPGEAAESAPESVPESGPPAKKAAKKTAKKAAAKKSATKAAKKPATKAAASADAGEPDGDAPDSAPPAKKTAAKRTSAKKAASGAKKKTKAAQAAESGPPGESGESGEAPEVAAGGEDASATTAVVFQAPEKPSRAAAKRGGRRTAAAEPAAADREDGSADSDKDGDKDSHKDSDKDSHKGDDGGPDDEPADGDDSGEGGNRRRRRRGGRRRRKPGTGGDDGEDSGDGSSSDDQGSDEDDAQDGQDGQGSEGGSRRRRRRRRPGEGSDTAPDDPEKTVTRVRKQRNPEDEITSIGGSTRLEAKKQRRREGREAGRRRAPIVSEAEFLARRESVERVMVIRQRDDLTQIAVLEDKVLVEHYVARESQTSLIGNVYLGRVQNVLPSMEAAFIDIGKGRNAVLYAGEVNWSALGHKDGQPRKIESVLSSGQTVLVQVTKDPVGHKGARLTGQVSLPGRFLVYVPEGTTSGISRKLPDTERNRLKTLLKEIVPNTAGVIVRTAAEGASEDELTHDVERLTARWGDIEEKVKAGKSPQLLYGEPDLTLKVVRDLFTEDFTRLVIQGDDAWDLVDGYVSHVAPDLRERLERYTAPTGDGEEAEHTDEGDVFASYRVDEQIAKGLDRKVWLPSGGSLIIDRTEAMTVVDVNTGKFTGSGGNLEETVTKNNLEAAEEIVRQLRLRDIGGIIVVDFIDMVLESNRDLVLRRLVECLGRDRTRHQVAEVTSLGLVQMTRKRIGTGLLEAFSTECEHCKGRGVVVHEHPVEPSNRTAEEPRGRRARGGRNRRTTAGGPGGSGGSGNGGGNGGDGGNGGNGGAHDHAPSPADLAGSRPPQQTEAESTGSDESEESEERPEPNVIGVPAASTAEPVQVPTDQSPDTDDSTTDDSTTDDSSDGAAVSEAPAETGAPRVVTRRRSARRAAGPPAEVDPTHVHGAGTPDGPAAEPVVVPVEPGEYQNEDQGDESDGDSSGLSLLHVPIKRKGRKR